jgi:hypothetical protein
VRFFILHPSSFILPEEVNMPQVKKSENWDGVTAPALPGGWHADPGFQTSNALFRSSPNSLRFFAPGNASFLYWTGTTDNFGGNARLTADVLFTGVRVQANWELLLRYNPATQSAYVLNLEPPGSVYDGITLFKVVNGAYTQLGTTVGAGQLALNAWYTAQLVAFNNTLTAYVQRVSDGYWYNGFSGWGPAKVVAAQATDGSLTGAGFAGLEAEMSANENNPFYSDNFLFEDLSPDAGILLKRRRRPASPVPVKKKRKRGWQWFYPALKPPPPDIAQWYQCSQDSNCGIMQACQPVMPGPLSKPCLIRYGVQGGPTILCDNNSSLVHVSEPAAQAPWPAGTWVVRLNVLSPGTSGSTWDSVYICRVDTGCNNQSTIASATGLAIDIHQPGGYSVTLQGAADAGASATDSFYIAYGFLNHGPPNQNLTIKLDQPIDTPFVYFTPIDGGVLDRRGLKNSAALRQPHKPHASLRRKLRLPAALLTPQPPATGPFATALFRRRRPRVSPSIRKDNTPFPRGGSFVRRLDQVFAVNLSPPPNLPTALFPRPRKRRPTRPVPRYRRSARWLPLAPVFVGSDKAMIAKGQVEENLQAAGFTLESLPSTALVAETMSGSAAIILGDVLRPLPVSVR